MKSLLATLLLFSCMPIWAQTEYEDLEFEMDSITKPYKPKGKHYVFMRSKRGSGGVPTTSSGDSINSFPITDIVLVYTELDASDFAERGKANRSRWKNLISTYPEYFDYSSTYKNVCQCNPNGDTAAFKRVQGFYIYYQSDEPDVVQTETKPAVVAPAVVAPAVVASKGREDEKSKSKEKVKEEEPATTREADKPKKNETSKSKEPEKTEVAEKKATAKSEEPVKTEEVKKVARQEVEEPAEEPEPAPVAAKPVKKKAPAANKPRKAKDPKACRTACYGYGDEDLNSFFAENVKLSKKQKKKGKNLMATVNLQLNVDGSIKKVTVTGPEPDFNQQVQEAAQGMNAWNPQVKNGVTIKSQVRITLKFDKASKTIKPSEVAVLPRPAPKCQCVSDAEIFGED